MLVNPVSAPTVSWAPAAEIRRLTAGVEDPAERTRVFATLCRLNTLAMIMWAGSGHLGRGWPGTGKSGRRGGRTVAA